LALAEPVAGTDSLVFISAAVGFLLLTFALVLLLALELPDVI